MTKLACTLYYQAKYRWLCAVRAPHWKQEAAARMANQAWDQWCATGYPGSRFAWYAVRAIHYSLWPVRLASALISRL